ncbi:MAG: XdhC family protein [Hyphomicrobium sp.]
MEFKFALVTLVNVVGSSPRPIGSVVAVSSEGHSAGRTSKTCGETARG